MAMPTLDGKVLITGASGFIGGRLRESLLRTDAAVVAIPTRPQPRRRLTKTVLNRNRLTVSTPMTLANGSESEPFSQVYLSFNAPRWSP